MGDLNNDDFNFSVSVLFLISCALSILASFFTIFLYLKFRPVKRSYPARLIVLVSLSDFLLWADRLFNILSKLISGSSFEERNNGYCIFSSIFRCFCVLFNLCCVFMITFALFYEIALFRNPQSIEVSGYFISSCFSLIMALIPFMMGEYGILDPYQCWITSNSLNLLIFYTPLIFVFISNFICVIYLIKVLTKSQGEGEKKKVILKFLMFPTILLIAWLPGLIRIAGRMDGTLIDGMMYIFMPIQGILNPFIYGSIFSILKNEVYPNSKSESIKMPFFIKTNESSEENEIQINH